MEWNEKQIHKIDYWIETIEQRDKRITREKKRKREVASFLCHYPGKMSLADLKKTKLIIDEILECRIKVEEDGEDPKEVCKESWKNWKYKSEGDSNE